MQGAEHIPRMQAGADLHRLPLPFLAGAIRGEHEPSLHPPIARLEPFLELLPAMCLEHVDAGRREHQRRRLPTMALYLSMITFRHTLDLPTAERVTVTLRADLPSRGNRQS